MKTIALLLDSDLSRSLRILVGVKDVISTLPDTRLAPLHHNQTDTLLHLLGSGSVDGVIGAFLGDLWLETLKPFGVPLVNIGTASAITSVPSVLPDFAAAGRLAADAFVRNGWQNTAIAYERADYASRLMHEGFTRRAAALNLAVAVVPADVVCSDAVRLGRWIATLPERTGCFCTSDFLARQAVQALLAHGRAVPDSVSVVGVGDSALDSVLSAKPLSSIILPDTLIGRTAATLMTAMLHRPQTRPASQTLPPVRLVVRESSALFICHDPLVARAVGEMEANLFRPCGIDELARRLGASKRSLELRFNAALGRSPAAEWRHRRHREICRLLVDTDIPLADIAALAGDGEPSYFWNAFRKTEDITPARYRATHRARK
ncbi:MAG: substrate-binding domain-containing protein [Kiritimatiellia bacterium]|jgi:LacI family transcriptional regulator